MKPEQNDDNIDILILDKKYREYNEYNKKKLSEYKKQLDNLNKMLLLNNITDNIKNNIENNIEDLKKFINNIEMDYTYNFYVMETSCILDKYRESLNSPIVIDFMSSKNTKNTNTDKIIDEYLNIYKKYNIEFDYIKKLNINCSICNSINIIYKDNLKLCLDCGNENTILLQTSSYKDSERINIVPKYHYDRKAHFKDCINQYQGKQQVNIPEEVYYKLINQFELNHILVGDKNDSLHYRCKNINKKQINIFLKELKLSKYYEDSIYIYNYLTGKKINDISHIEKQIINDFETLLVAYDNYNKENKIERKSFINIQYVLMQLLIKHKHKVNKDDFNILKTNDRQRFHDQICKELFKRLGWNFTCIF